MISKKKRRVFKNLWKAMPIFQREDNLKRRARVAALVRELEENGQVAVVTSGMDCDCCRWDDVVEILPAVPIEVERWADEYYERAEGPQSHYLERPSKAKKLRAGHRDLALEAFEEGHPNVIYY